MQTGVEGRRDGGMKASVGKGIYIDSLEFTAGANTAAAKYAFILIPD